MGLIDQYDHPDQLRHRELRCYLAGLPPVDANRCAKFVLKDYVTHRIPQKVGREPKWNETVLMDFRIFYGPRIHYSRLAKPGK